MLGAEPAWAARDERWPAAVTRQEAVAVETALRAKRAYPQSASLDRRAPPEPSPRLLSPEQRRVFDVVLDPALAPAPVADCDDDAFATKTGADLVAHIRTTPYDCINRLFSKTPARFAAMRRQNVIDVAEATRLLAVDYDGTNESRIVEMFLFLRIGFYVNFGEGHRLDWNAADEGIAAAVGGALDAFKDNDHFLDETEAHIDHALWEGVGLMGSSGLAAGYLGATKSWLGRWRPELVDIRGAGAAINQFFTLLYLGHQRQAFADAVAGDHELVRILREFALNDWMLGTDVQYLAENAGLELGRFSQYRAAPIHASVRAAVGAILDRYEMLGEGSGIWIATAKSAVFYDGCEPYGICGFEKELEAHVLAVNHVCSDSVTIRAQRLEPSELDAACALLAAQEELFHRRLRTGRTPVPDDFNASLEIVVFADSVEYESYSGLFFGNDTDNGGIYLEGDPSDPDNTARFIAYVAVWLEDRPIWNLEHEQVHYLDGRFNMHGSFADYRMWTHHTVWWAEGLAEYVSRRNDNAAAVDVGRAGGVELSKVFPIVYGDGNTKVYRWTYLAVRFMFERHRDVVDILLAYLRRGDYETFRAYLREEIGTGYDAEFSAWLQDAAATDVDTPELVELPRALGLDEGSTSTYRIALGAAPTADVDVRIAAAGTDLQLAPASLQFSPQDWSSPQTVRVAAREDADAADETGTLLHTASGGGYDTARALVAVAVTDSAPTISFVDASVAVREGGTAVLEVATERALEAATTFAYRTGSDANPATYDADAADHAGDGEATIPAGATRTRIEIPIHDDTEIEPATETFVVSLDPTSIAQFRRGQVRAAVVIEEGVCDRSPAVRDALRRERPCEAVSDADLADEFFLNLADRLDGPLRTGDFQGLTGVVDIRLYDNRLETLPPGLLSDMRSLSALYLNDNDLADLPTAPLRGAGGLTRLSLNTNDLSELPAEFFAGIGRLTALELQGNPGAPFPLTLEWSRVRAFSVAATVREGAPFDMRAEVSALGGTLSTDSVLVRAGATMSEPVTITPDGTGPVRIAFVGAPVVPDAQCGEIPCFHGVATAVGTGVAIEADGAAFAAGYPTRHALPAGVAKRIPLADLFPGMASGDAYAATSSDPSILGAYIDDGTLVLSAKAAGVAVVTVKSGASGSHGLDLLVRNAAPVRTSIPYLPSVSEATGRRGFLRIINHRGMASALGIDAYDNDGAFAGTLALSIAETGAVHVNAQDLADGNRGKRLFGALGSDAGSWRLSLASIPGIEVLAYVRTPDGLLASIHDVAPRTGSVHRVATFNPGRNTEAESLLLMSNPTAAAAGATIRGIDNAGAPGGEVAASIPAHGSLIVSASELESGAAPGLSGALGGGAGKWRLDVESAVAIDVVSLLSSATGHLTNLSSAAQNRTGGALSVPLFPPAGVPGRQGFVRVINRGQTQARVTVAAFDDTGRHYEPLVLTVGANKVVQFNSADLESGNEDKGLIGSTGAGEGDWRLELASEDDIEVLSYIRTRDGFLTSMHDVVPGVDGRHRVPTFNPGRNTNQVSRLRLVNAGDEPARVTITGIDNAGKSSTPVRLAVAAGAAESFTAAELEAGHADLDGALGTGRGKWQLVVESDRPITVMSLLEIPSGHVTNLSSTPSGTAIP